MSKYAIIITPKVALREGIASLLRDTYKVVATAAGPADLAGLQFPKRGPLLAIVGVDGQSETLHETAASVRLLRSSAPDAKIMLLLETNRPVDLQRILAISPDACILNVPSRDLLLKTIELTFLGQRVLVLPADGKNVDVIEPLLPSESSAPAVNENDRNQLSPRECQIAMHLAHGNSNKMIARLCKISEATVKAHPKAILRKTRLKNRTQAAVWAVQHGFRDLRDDLTDRE